MRRLLSTCLVLPVLTLALACNKPPIEDCRKACWNGMKVRFWAQVDREVSGLTPEAAAEHRAIKEVEFQAMELREEDQGFMNCVSQCHSEGTKEAVACMTNAKTEAKLLVCLDK